MGQAVCRDEGSKCWKATNYELGRAGITDEHDFKKEYIGESAPTGRYDICACEDGSIKIAGRTQCSNSRAPKIDTYARHR